MINHLNKYDMITYQAINYKNEEKLNVSKDDVNAVTWGVFKGKEVLQPTVVDHTAFVIWKDEIFAQWIDPWAIIYGLDTDSYKFLNKCYESFYLVNIVDNDFIHGDLDKVITDFINDNESLISSL